MVLDSGSNYLRSQKLLLYLDETIKASVTAASQTTLDKANMHTDFPQIEREDAFVELKERIFKIIDRNDLKFLEPHIGNIDEWMNSRIEYYLETDKCKKT